MTEPNRGIPAVPPTTGVAQTYAVRPNNVGQEQIASFDQLLEYGRGSADARGPAVEDPGLELVTTLTQDEIHRIEDHLPDGSTVASILGRPLDYVPNSQRRRVSHLPSVDGHVDVDV